MSYAEQLIYMVTELHKYLICGGGGGGRPSDVCLAAGVRAAG